MFNSVIAGTFLVFLSPCFGMTADEIIEYCNQNPKVVKAHEKYCHQYYDCTKKYNTIPLYFTEHLYECPYTRMFDEDSKNCESYNKTEHKCNGRIVEKDACKFLQNQSGQGNSRPCNLDFPSCGDKNDGIYAHPRKPMSPYYMVCHNGFMNGVYKCDSNPVQKFFKDGKCQ